MSSSQPMETVADLSDNRQNSKKRPASAITIEAEIHDLPSDSQLIERQATKKQKNQPNKRRRSTSVDLQRSKPSSVSDSDNCVFCGVACGTGDSIDCSDCKLSFHLSCCGLPQQHHANALLFLRVLDWKCDGCRQAFSGRVNDLEQLVKKQEVKIASLTKMLNNLKLSKANASHSDTHDTSMGPLPVGSTEPSTESKETNDSGHKAWTKAQVVTLIAKTVNDKDRRKRNVIVSGIPESTPEADQRTFLSICEQYLSTKPAISSLGTKRLGKASPNASKHRRLLVHLETESAATTILQSARRLRDADDASIADHVFINPDLSIADQKEAFDRRLKRRARQAAGTVDQNVAGTSSTPPDATSEMNTSDTQRRHRQDANSGPSGPPQLSQTLQTPHTLQTPLPTASYAHRFDAAQHNDPHAVWSAPAPHQALHHPTPKPSHPTHAPAPYSSQPNYQINHTPGFVSYTAGSIMADQQQIAYHQMPTHQNNYTNVTTLRPVYAHQPNQSLEHVRSQTDINRPPLEQQNPFPYCPPPSTQSYQPSSHTPAHN